jgi:hypothetical protein
MYLTVLRQSSASKNPTVSDGFGFAIIRGNEGITDSTKYDDYNVYIVDNNILTNNILFSSSTIQMANIGNYISAAKARIEKNTEYYFEFHILEDWATRLWIWQNGTEKSDLPLIVSGALANGPVGLGKTYVQSATTGQQMILPEGTDVGIGVMNPSGYQWDIKNIEIKYLSEGMPLQLFEFSNANEISLGIDGKVQVSYYGGAESLLNASNTVAVKGVDIYIAKVKDPAAITPEFDSWEYLGELTGGITVDGADKRIFSKATSYDSKYYEFGGKIYVAVCRNFKADANVDLNSAYIQTDYIELTDQKFKSLKDRNVVDIWVDPKQFLETDTLTIVASSNTTDPGIMKISDLKKPLFLVEAITQNGANVLSYTETTTGFKPVILDKGLLYSSKGDLYLAIPENVIGEEFTIDYVHAKTKVESLQNFVENSAYRAPAIDPLVRILPPILFSIETEGKLNFKGVQTIAEVQNILINYITNLANGATITKSDLLSTLYSNGVSYIDISTLKCYITEFHYENFWVNKVELVDEYTPSNSLNMWYTSAKFLKVAKL